MSGQRRQRPPEPAAPPAGAPRRGYGSGSLYQRAGNWYGRWYRNGERVKLQLGPVRPPGRAMASRAPRPSARCAA